MTAQVFAITLDGIVQFWTGTRNADGLVLTEKRADAMKFHDRGLALAVAETHPELQDSDLWRLEPLGPGCERTA